MKSNSPLILLVILLVSLASCRKSDSAGGDTPVKKTKFLTELKRTQDGVTTTTYYTFDGKKRVKTVKLAGSTTTYEYNGEQLFSVEIYQPANNFRDVTEFIYANDGTIATARKRIYRNNAPDFDKTYRYYYTNDKVTQVKQDLYTYTYTYDSRGNITKAFTDELNGGFAFDFTYDDKVNAYANGFPKYILNNDVANASVNNQLTRPSTTITYVYDADGYPTTATWKTPAGTTTFTYIYSEL